MTNKHGKPTAEAFKDAALALIQSESTMTLATTGQSGPWSAPVYHVFINGRFCFFSSPESRHIRQALDTGAAAASLFCRAESWQAIRGIQMAGTVGRIRSAVMSVKVVAVYLKRFPFTLEFFPGNASPDAEAFFSRFKARLYAFTPTDIFYIDNRLGFGTRQRVDRIDG